MKIAIVGLGIQGRLIAYNLLRYAKQHTEEAALDLCLFHDRPLADTSMLSFVAGGMIAPVSEAALGEPEVAIQGGSAIDLWHEIVANLDAAHCLKQNGTLIVSHPRDRPLVLEFMQKSRGVAKELSHCELANLEPSLEHSFSSALLVPHEGHINPEVILRALGDRINAEVCSLKTSIKVKIQGASVRFDHELISDFDWIIDTRGYGAKKDCSDLRPVRGEALILKCQNFELMRPVRLLHPRYALYLIPRGENHFFIGATSIESESDSDITVESSLELLSAVYSIHPSIKQAEVVCSKVGIRPTSSSGLPSITREGRILRVNGLGRHGYLLAPKMAQEVRSIILGEESAALD